MKRQPKVFRKLENKDILVRTDSIFKKELDDIVLQRIKLGKEVPTHPRGSRRITQAIRRHSKWKDIKSDIINADLD